ncbi:TlpA family protein disulfide reductase [Sinomicrobium sp. M5D2P9]
MIKKNVFSTLAGIILFSNCARQEKSSYAILSGVIKNGKQTIELRSHYNTTDKSKTKIIHLDEDGTFLDSLHIEKSELYLLWDKTNMVELYLTPSKKYSIDYDAKKFKSEGVTLKGDDIAINEYYIDKTRNEGFSNYNGEGKSEKELRNSLNKIKEKQLERLNASKLPDVLKMHESSSINYEYLRNLFLHLGLNDIDTPSVASKKELNIDYLNEEDYKKYASYKYLVSDYFNTQIRNKEKEYKKQDSSYSINQHAIKELALLIPNEHIKNDLIASAASFYLLGSKDIEACYNDFKKYYTGNDSIIKAEMLDSYNRFTLLKKGTPSPKFINYKNYNGGVNSLDDFKGMFVFIDIWASWCGNCFFEIPALKKLEKDYKDKNIVFLSIAWKDDEDKWRETVKRESLTGIQLFASKKDNTFFDEYRVSGIPRYILIDPEGNIVDYSTPRPSEGKLTALFKSIGME